MKFSVQRDNFIRLLGRAQGVVEKKSTVAVLSHLLLETVGDDGIKLTCTDYDVVLMDHCPAVVERDGKAVISGKTIFDIVKVLPSLDIQLDKGKDERIHISAGTSKYDLAGLDPDDFPRIEKDDSEPGFSLPIKEFRRMLAKSAFCMSTEEARMNLNGIYFDIKKNDDGKVSLACVSTDGHRLAKVERVFEGLELPFDNRGVIVHRKGVTELKKIMDSEIGDVHVGFASGEVVFRVGTAALFVREIDEEYPDYESVIPDEFNRHFVVDVPDLVEAMRRVVPMADPNSLTVKMEVRPEALVLSSANSQTGFGETSIYADYDGTPFVVGFNQRYLHDCVTAVEAPQVLVKMTEPGSPCVLEPSDPDEGSLFVLMPVEEP
jgi:DNA polymerase III subunit beta